MNKKFDGPSFVNPQHTSYNLNNGSYQTPKVNFNTSSQTQINPNLPKEDEKSKNRKGPRGWEDDEDVILKSASKKPCGNKSSIFNSITNRSEKLNTLNVSCSKNTQDEIKSESEKVESFSSYTNYWDSENTKKIQNSTLSVEYEMKLIDDILMPTGVTVKPSDTQIKDFLKRLKTLKKEIVLNILFDRLKSYESMGDTTQFKVLQKLLYVVIATLNDKIEGFSEFFQENQEIFNHISQFYSSNKKLVELIFEIYDLLNGSVTSGNKKIKNKPDMQLIDLAKNTEDSINSYSSDKTRSISKENKQKFNFIKKKGPQTSEDTEIGLISIEKKDNFFDKLNNNSNLLNSSQSKTHSESNLTNIISNEGISNYSIDSQSNNPKFSFIKIKKNDTSSNSLVNISSQGNNICNNENYSNSSVNKGLNLNEISNDLNNVFYQPPYTAQFNKDYLKNDKLNNKGITNSYHINSMNINGNIFSDGDNSNTNFLNNITKSNNYSYIPDKKHYPANFDMLFDPALMNSGLSLIDGNSTSIRYDVNCSTSNSNESNQPKKDPFEFVNDFLKPRK